MSLLKNFVSVGSWTIVSRLAGFVRDALMAAVLGVGPVADAFNAAFRFPNLFRRLFAEGAFNTAFVPMFSGALEQQGDDGARELAARIMSWLVAMLIGVTILVEIFIPQIMVACVPVFPSAREQQGDDGAREAAARVMSWLVAMLIVVTLLVEIFTPQIVVAFVPGFVDDKEKFDLTVLLTRSMFPYLACMSLMA